MDSAREIMWALATAAAPMFPTDIQRATKLWAGTLYLGLMQLEREGLIQSEWSETEGHKRRIYRLTETGASDARAIHRDS
jgi:DNA-binding PadR family transcriptional regulator